MTDFGRRPGVMLKSVYDTDESGVVDQVEVAPAHKTSHQALGSDLINVANLDGRLWEPQWSEWDLVTLKPTEFNPEAHKADHQHGGADQIDCAALSGRINYVDRGDPSAWDFTLGDFYTNGSWHTLDLSPTGCSGAYAVRMIVELKDNLVGSYIQIRRVGNQSMYNSLGQYTQRVGVPIQFMGVVENYPPAAVSYRTTNTTFNAINLVVIGWFI